MDANKTTQGPDITPAEVVAALDRADRFMEVLHGLGRVANNAVAIQNLEAAAQARCTKAVELADEAERVTAEKLEMFNKKIQRASEESDRIMAKATKDAKEAVETATAEALKITDAAKKSRIAAEKAESAAKARTAELTRTIGEQEKTLAGLNKAIDAAKEKIASFQK